MARRVCSGCGQLGNTYQQVGGRCTKCDPVLAVPIPHRSQRDPASPGRLAEIKALYATGGVEAVNAELAEAMKEPT